VATYKGGNVRTGDIKVGRQWYKMIVRRMSKGGWPTIEFQKGDFIRVKIRY